jgi:hypothetical protein
MATESTQATLSFLGVVNIAVRLVTEEYPGAELLEGDGVSPSGPTTDPKKVDSWRFVFRAGENGTALIHTTQWGEFGPIHYIDQPWLEDVVIPWPFEMDIVEADRLLKQAGYTDPYVGVTVRWPLYPGVKEPYYIFNFGNQYYVFVGIYDGSVSPND